MVPLWLPKHNSQRDGKSPSPVSWWDNRPPRDWGKAWSPQAPSIRTSAKGISEKDELPDFNPPMGNDRCSRGPTASRTTTCLAGVACRRSACTATAWSRWCRACSRATMQPPWLTDRLAPVPFHPPPPMALHGCERACFSLDLRYIFSQMMCRQDMDHGQRLHARGRLQGGHPQGHGHHLQ